MVEWGRGVTPPFIEGTCHVSLHALGPYFICGFYMWVLRLLGL